MKSTPPSIRDVLETAPESHESRFAQNMHSNLSSRPWFHALTPTQQRAVQDAFLTLNLIRGSANSRIDQNNYTLEERRFIAPPHHASKGRAFKDWQRQHQLQMALDHSECAILAVEKGNLAEALNDAMRAQEFSLRPNADVGYDAVTGGRKRGYKTAPDPMIIERNNNILCEAKRIRQEKPGVADRSIAAIITNKKNIAKGLGTESIRRIISTRKSG